MKATASDARWADSHDPRIAYNFLSGPAMAVVSPALGSASAVHSVLIWQRTNSCAYACVEIAHESEPFSAWNVINRSERGSSYRAGASQE